MGQTSVDQLKIPGFLKAQKGLNHLMLLVSGTDVNELIFRLAQHLFQNFPDKNYLEPQFDRPNF